MLPISWRITPKSSNRRIGISIGESGPDSIQIRAAFAEGTVIEGVGGSVRRFGDYVEGFLNAEPVHFLRMLFRLALMLGAAYLLVRFSIGWPEALVHFRDLVATLREWLGDVVQLR